MIEILAYYEIRKLPDDRRLPKMINELVARQGRAALVACSSLMSGEALVLYVGHAVGDGVVTGAAFDRELERELRAALLAKVEGGA